MLLCNCILGDKYNKITKRDLKDLALNNNLIHVGVKETQDKEEHSDQAAYMALNKNLIEPLMDCKFISVEKIGARHIVSLTDEGINIERNRFFKQVNPLHLFHARNFSDSNVKGFFNQSSDYFSVFYFRNIQRSFCIF